VLPLHPHLIVMLREWLVAFGPNDFLFPKLANRRTWLMVKKDPERVGIPYETDDGIVDFHAVGRHTHITELLRNGVSLPEARELARHSDDNMTMRYTHSGIEDQAKAIAKLPNSCPHIVSTPGDSRSPEQSRAVAESQDEGAGQVDETSAGVSPSDTKKQKKSPPVEDGDLWRRRESNEQATLHNQFEGNDFGNRPIPLGASGECRPSSDCQCSSCADMCLDAPSASIQYVAEAWSSLPPHIREAIMTLIDAALPPEGRAS